MRSLWVLFILVGAVWAQDSGSCDGCTGPQGLGMASARVSAHKMRLDTLNTAIDGLEGRINDALSSDIGDAANNLAARLNKLEGTGCELGMFQCGGNARDCISSLLACDGSNDCGNGADESDDTCRVLTPAGSAWEGDTNWDQCRIANNERLRVVITGNRRVKYFPTRLWVNAMITFTEDRNGQGKVVNSFNTRGFYSFGDRMLVLAPPEKANISVGIACRFNSDTQADCQFRQRSSLAICGTTRLNRA